jgi:nucleoside-diphosphate-sugar epimerase
LAELVRDVCQATVEIQNVEPNRSRFSDEYCRIPVGMTTKADSEWIDERDYVADVTRAREELDYEPAVDVREGVRRTAEWMRSNEF